MQPIVISSPHVATMVPPAFVQAFRCFCVTPLHVGDPSMAGVTLPLVHLTWPQYGKEYVATGFMLMRNAQFS